MSHLTELEVDLRHSWNWSYMKESMHIKQGQLRGGKMKKPEKRILLICLFCFMGIGILYFFKYQNEYNINNSNNEIKVALEKKLGTDVTVRASRVTDNKLHFVYTFDDSVGSGELLRGWNQKYKFEFYGYGTNWIRERIIETKNGQYLMLAGRNDKNIGLIQAYIQDDEYDVLIPDEDFYLVMTKLKNTKQEFTSGMIIYDRNRNEIERINLPRE